MFLSDFGLDDEFVGICHGVMARVSPESRVIDLTHSVPSYDVEHAALLLSDSLPYIPEDAVLLAVVDPGVGTPRRALAAEALTGRQLVGPDNGILSLAWDRLGGVTRAVEVTAPSVVQPHLSGTFHGRDVFAPAAARLARGIPLEDLGLPVDPASLATLDPGRADVVHGRVQATVRGIDRFGNVQLNVIPEDLARAGLDAASILAVRTDSGRVTVRRASTFGDVEQGRLAALIDSRGRLAVIENGGSAAATLRLAPGDPVVVEPSE